MTRAVLLVSFALSAAVALSDVTVGNGRFALRLDDAGRARSLVVKATGEECLDDAAQVPFFSVTQERPFNNENKLAHPNRRTTYPATKVVREGDLLVVNFRLVRYAAEIKVVERPDYVLFELQGFRNADADYGSMKIDRPPAVELRLADLPVKPRTNFGDWLGVVWDDRAAVAVLGTSPDTFVGSEAGVSRRRLTGGSAALVAAAGREPFLDCVDAFERDLGLPRGVANRRNPLVNASVFWVKDLLPSNVDDYIAYAKKGGFRLMLVYYRSLVKENRHWCRTGEWAFRGEYTNGFADVTAMLDKVRAAGLVPGLHVLQTHIGLETSYVTPVADHRLGLKRHFTLAKPLGEKDTELYVEESTAETPRIAGARVLRFGGELLTYEDFTSEQKRLLRDPKREFHLFVTENGGYELVEIEMLPTPAKAKDVRGFVFERNGRRVVACWHSSGAGTVRLGAPWNETLSVGDLRYVETGLEKKDVLRSFASAVGT